MGSEVDLFKCINYAIGSSFCDVVKKRLTINFNPPCLNDIIFCKENHKKNGKSPQGIANSYRGTVMITDAKIIHFIRLVSDQIIEGSVPHPQTIVDLLYIILTFHHKSKLNEKHPVNYILSECEILFHQIHMKFPPCWFPLRSVYRQMITMESSTHTWLNGSYDTQKGIFWVVIEMLEDLLLKESTKEVVDNDNDDSDTDEELFYKEWETKHTQIKSHQEAISRDDKIRRGFLILKMLAGLLEHDLAMFIKKHSRNIQTKMGKPNLMPIISSLFWDSEVGHINFNTKRLVQLFVNCVSLHFSKDEIDTLSRILNLLSVGVNLCEQPRDEEISQYPLIGSYTQCLISEINKIILNTSYDINLYLSVLDNLKTPVTKLLLSNLLITKFNNRKNPDRINIETFFESFVNRYFLQCSPGSHYVLKKDTETPDDKYGVLTPEDGAKRRKKSNEILMIDFLYLLEIAFKSYIELYALDVAIETFAKKDPDLKQVSSDIFVDKTIVLAYREDIKYFLLIKNLLSEYQIEYRDAFGDIFCDWILLMNKK